MTKVGCVPTCTYDDACLVCFVDWMLVDVSDLAFQTLAYSYIRWSVVILHFVTCVRLPMVGYGKESLA